MSLSLSPGEKERRRSLWGRRRPRHRRGWEEKVAAVAQSARVSATRDGLPVGQSQLRAPDQALGERTNKCSRARIPALAVTTGGDSGQPRSRPHAPSLARCGAPRPFPSAPSHGATRLDSYQTFPPWARDPGLRGLPAWFHLEFLPGLEANSPPPRGPPSLQPFWGGAPHAPGSSGGSPAPLLLF